MRAQLYFLSNQNREHNENIFNEDFWIFRLGVYLSRQFTLVHKMLLIFGFGLRITSVKFRDTLLFLFFLQNFISPAVL